MKMRMNFREERALYKCAIRKNSNFYYTYGITPKRVTSGGAHLRGLAPGQYSFEETSERWRVIGDTASDLPGPGNRTPTSRTDSIIVLPTELSNLQYF